MKIETRKPRHASRSAPSSEVDTDVCIPFFCFVLFFGPHTYKFFSVPHFSLATNNPNSSFKLKPKHVAFSVSMPITSSVTPNTSSSLIEVGSVRSRLLVSALEADPCKEEEGVWTEKCRTESSQPDPWRAWDMRKSLGLYQAAANSPELHIPPG